MTTTRTAPDRALIERLAEAARTIRRLSVAAIYRAGSGHPGGALSCAEILACLYGSELRQSPSGLDDPERDRFVMSKGHSAPALYAAGAYFGYCSAADVLTLRQLGSAFQGHPHVLDLEWVETSTGSLGQGFSVAIGMAIGLKLRASGARAYALLGDGELQEGEVWEGAMCANQHRLDNLCALIDYNKMQSDDLNENIVALEPLADKWRAFGWHVEEVDGHDLEAIFGALARARESVGAPSMIIAHTVKGHGVPYMDGSPEWHGSVALSREQAASALAALGATQSDIASLVDDRG
jgi:transketolase